MKKEHIDHHCHCHSHSECSHHKDNNIIELDSCCDCYHNKDNNTSKFILLLSAIILFIAGLILKFNFIFILAYLIAGYDIIIKASKINDRKNFFDENLLMTVATLGALALGEFSEASAVMIFYKIGETLQDYAVECSEKSINSILNIRPDYAYILRNGERVRVNANTVKKDEVIVVSPGERIPLDGIIIDGLSYIDNSCISGESIPLKVKKNDFVMSGAINKSGILQIKTTEDYSNSTASRIIDIMKNSLEKKAKSERFITTFSKKYTPTVIALALLTAIIPPIIIGDNFSDWLYKGLTLLVISCPCALVLSIPLSFFAGIGAMSKKGVIVKGGNAIEALSKTDMMVFDKTGTLTKGKFEVSEIMSTDKSDFLNLCAYAEFYSDHPIAEAIKKHCNISVDESLISEYNEIPGKGISVNVSGNKILIGNEKLFDGINISKETNYGTVVHMSVNGIYKGYLTVSDTIRDNDIIKKLNGIKTVILTGDNEASAKTLASQLGINDVYSNLLPEDKVSVLEKLSQNQNCAFIGDGINDAPVLSLAGVGIAMGGIGSDAAIEAADIILTDDNLNKIPAALKIAKKTMRIIKQNIILAIGIKILIMILNVSGFTTMWLAIFADVGVALLAIFNALRAMK